VVETDPIDRLFKLLTEEFYCNSLQPFLAERFAARQLVFFFVKLPFHVPVDGLVTVQVYEPDCALAFGFRSASETLQIDPAGAVVGTSSVSVLRTTVEMVCTLPHRLPTRARFETLPRIFDRLVYGLNLFLRAYIITHRDLDVFPVSEKALPLAVFFRIVNPRKWQQPEDGMLGLHTDLPAIGKPPLDVPSRDEVARRAILLHSGANPFLLSQEMAAAAFRWLRDGWDRDAVVNAQTSVETLAGALTIQLEVAEGKPIEKATVAYTEKATRSFLSAIRNLQHFIGGCWDLSRESTPPGAWHASCYLLRNRIVHAGYAPSHDEARAACRSAEDLRVYVAQLLGNKREYREIYERLRETGVEDWAKA
jgi:hypothetical protein